MIKVETAFEKSETRVISCMGLFMRQRLEFLTS